MDGRAVIDVDGESCGCQTTRSRSLIRPTPGMRVQPALPSLLSRGGPFIEACRFGHAAALATAVLGARASLPGGDAVEALLRTSS